MRALRNPYDYYITPEEYEIAAQHGVSEKTLDCRVRMLGWDKQRAITTPPQKRTDRSNWIKIAEANGINYKTFISRVNIYGMSDEEAATRPLQDPQEAAATAREARRRHPVKYVKLAKRNGIPYGTFRMRVKRYGWSYEEAATRPVMSKSETGKLGIKALREQGALIYGRR